MSNADVTVTGNITMEPELTFSGGGAARLSFSIASNRRYQVDGEWKEETSFFNVVAWRGIAENAAAVLEKGMPVMVKGRLEQRSWEDKEGNKRSTVEVVADNIAINTFGLESVERKQRSDSGGRSSSAPRSKASSQVPDSDPFEAF